MATSSLLERYGPAALVTGASSGIGEHFAILLAEAGFDLLLTARRRDRLEKLADKLKKAHQVQCVVCDADLATPEGAPSLYSQAQALDIGLVVCNAGFGLKGLHEKNDFAEIHAMLNVNNLAALQLSHHFIPKLLQRGRGGLLFTSSVEGFFGFPYSAAYSASKAFLKSLGEGLWGELQPRGVDVLVLCPGSTDTETMAKQNIDTTNLEMMAPREVAQIGLDNLANGPVVIAGEGNQQMVDGLLSMNRPEAIKIMAENMKNAIKGVS